MDWSTTTSRKRRRAKKDDDEDEEYTVAAQPKPVTEDGVAKIMSTLLQAREQWVINKLLSRLQVLSIFIALILDERQHRNMASGTKNAWVSNSGRSVT